jgi:hypothetical protein
MEYVRFCLIFDHEEIISLLGDEMDRSFFLFARPSFVGGVARLFDFGGTLNTYNISATSEMADARAFYEDWKAIGDDMRAALENYRSQQNCELHG